MFKTMSNYCYKKLMNYEQSKFGHEKKILGCNLINCTKTTDKLSAVKNESISSVLVLQAVCLRLISGFQPSFHKYLGNYFC